MSRIIQLVTHGLSLVALCDDGQLWRQFQDGTGWTRIDIPDAMTEKPDDGWIEWNGGDCPVEDGTFVDIKLRGGSDFFHQVAFRSYQEPRDLGVESKAIGSFWMNEGHKNDIIAYRIHNSQTNPKEG